MFNPGCTSTSFPDNLRRFIRRKVRFLVYYITIISLKFHACEKSGFGCPAVQLEHFENVMKETITIKGSAALVYYQTMSLSFSTMVNKNYEQLAVIYVKAGRSHDPVLSDPIDWIRLSDRMKTLKITLQQLQTNV